MNFNLGDSRVLDFDEYWGRIKITVNDYLTSGNVDETTLNERKS